MMHSLVRVDFVRVGVVLACSPQATSTSQERQTPMYRQVALLCLERQLHLLSVCLVVLYLPTCHENVATLACLSVGERNTSLSQGPQPCLFLKYQSVLRCALGSRSLRLCTMEFPYPSLQRPACTLAGNTSVHMHIDCSCTLVADCVRVHVRWSVPIRNQIACN